MGSKNIRNDMLDIFLHTDEVGNPQSIEELNEPQSISNCHIMLSGVPDSGYGVTIDNMIEINIKKKINNSNEFKVDYRYGRVYFHPSLEGQSINIDRYYSRGVIKLSAKRIYLESGKDMPTDTDLETYIDNVQDTYALDQTIQTNESNRQTKELERQQLYDDTTALKSQVENNNTTWGNNDSARTDAENNRASEFNNMVNQFNNMSMVEVSQLTVTRSEACLHPLTGEVIGVDTACVIPVYDEPYEFVTTDVQINSTTMKKPSWLNKQLRKMNKELFSN